MESSIGISPTSRVVDGRSRLQPKTFDGSSRCFPSVVHEKRLLGNARLDSNLHRSSAPRFVIRSKSRLWQEGKGKPFFSVLMCVFCFLTSNKNRCKEPSALGAGVPLCAHLVLVEDRFHDCGRPAKWGGSRPTRRRSSRPAQMSSWTPVNALCWKSLCHTLRSHGLCSL